MTNLLSIRPTLILVVLVFSTNACAQLSNSKPSPPVLITNAPLAHYDIKPSDLPQPKIEDDVNNGPNVIAQPANATLNVPKGFEVTTFAEGGFTRPRWMALAPNGDVFLADSEGSQIFVLRDANKDGVAEQRFVFVDEQKQPFGIAFWKDYVYIGNTDAVVRYKYMEGQTKATGVAEKIADLPGRGYREHWTRNILFSPDGKKMYVTVGSESNASVEGDPMRASITEFNPDGSGKRIYASGTRNPIGLAWLPGTNRMMRFELGLEKPEPRRAVVSAFTIAGAYVAGGFIPLTPYIFASNAASALLYSIVATLIALFIFGFVKGRFTGTRPMRSALQTALIGSVAAGAAFAIARLISV